MNELNTLYSLFGLIASQTTTILGGGYLIYKYRKKIETNVVTENELKVKLLEIEKINGIIEVSKRNESFLKYNTQVDEYLTKKLEKLFNSFIFKKVLYTLREFSSTISEEERNRLRIQFLEYLEFTLNEDEKTMFMKRFNTFEQFKFTVVDYFNIKLTKLELTVCHKLDIKEEEFEDHKLIHSLYDTFTAKEMKNITNIIQEFNSESPKLKHEKEDK